MSARDECIFANDCNTDVLPVESVVGADFDTKNNGISSVPSVNTSFDNAFRVVGVDTNIYTSSDIANVSINEGIFECWLSPHFDVVNGGSQSGRNQFMAYNYNNIAPIDALNLFFFTNRFRFQFSVNGSISNFDTTSASFDLTAFNWYHLAFLWNISAPAKKRVIYLDGVEIASSGLSWTIGAFTIPVVVGGVISLPGNQYTDFDMDKIRMYKSASVITEVLDNRNNALFPFGGFSKLLDGGLESPQLSGVLM
jgi:hypothetical protein